jgi:predicted RNA binding protein YcfA (HicA-like mRNA interferase family)
MKKPSEIFNKIRSYNMQEKDDKQKVNNMKAFGTLFTESVKEVERLEEQIQLLDEMPGANMDTRAVHKHLKKQGWSLTRSSGGHDVFTHPEAKHHIPVPRHRQLKAPLVRGILKQSQVNEAKDEQEYGYEGDMAMNQLETIIRHATYLKDMMKPDTDLPEWVQSKITLAQDYIQTACDYMTSEMKEEVKDEYARKVDKYLKKKYNKEEVELDEARMAASASTRAGLAKRNAGMPNKSNLSPAEEAAKKKESDASFARLMAYADKQKAKTNEEVEQLEEGRPSQRHPLEGHEYHRKTDAELEYIAKDAHKAAEAMKGHNTDAENKYRDQASDSATVRYFRKKNGMQPWYKKKYGHVNEETSKHAGWIAHYNGQKHEIPKEHAKDLYDAKQKAIAHFKAPKSKHSLIAIKPAYNEEVVVEDNVINTNSPNSVLNNPATQQATSTNITKKKQVIDRYTTGKSSAVSGTTVVASPRESVEIQEGRMKDMASDDDFHPTVTKSEPPFDGPYKTKPKNVTDKSGAVHTPMSRAKDLAKRAARKNGGLKEDNDNTLSSYDKEDTPAKKTLSKTAGMVKDLATNAKVKAKGKKSDDTFQPEPELASNIVR